MFMINTPAIIRANPMIAGKSRCCLKMKKPINAINTIPIPDQMAYAIPTGIVFRTILRQ